MAMLIGALLAAGVAVTFLDQARHPALWACAGIAVVCTCSIWWAFRKAHGRRRHIEASPWEQGVAITPRRWTFASLDQAHAKFGFSRPAMILRSAEAEHLEEPWTQLIDCQLKARLNTPTHRHSCEACEEESFSHGGNEPQRISGRSEAGRNPFTANRHRAGDVSRAPRQI
jgi:hypothetical protein